MKTNIEVESIAEQFVMGRDFGEFGITGYFQRLEAVEGNLSYERRGYKARSIDEVYELALKGGLTEIPGLLLN